MLVGAVLVACSAAADADPTAAERAIERAEARARRGDLAGAAASYRDAFREEPRPALLCSIGVAYYEAKDRPRAHRYLDQCLAAASALDPALVGTVRSVLSALEHELGAGPYKPLDIFVDPPLATTTFDKLHDDVFVGSRRAWVSFGTYRATVQAPGYVDHVIEIDARDTRPTPYTVQLEPAPAETAPQPRAAPSIAASLAHVAPRRSLVAPVLVSSGACVLGAAALGAYASALHRADEAGDPDISPSQYETLAAEARRHQRLSWALGAAAGATGVLGALLWYRASRSPPRVDVGVSGGGGGGNVSLSHRW